MDTAAGAMTWEDVKPAEKPGGFDGVGVSCRINKAGNPMLTFTFTLELIQQLGWQPDTKVKRIHIRIATALDPNIEGRRYLRLTQDSLGGYHLASTPFQASWSLKLGRQPWQMPAAHKRVSVKHEVQDGALMLTLPKALVIDPQLREQYEHDMREESKPAFAKAPYVKKAKPEEDEDEAPRAKKELPASIQSLATPPEQVSRDLLLKKPKTQIDPMREVLSTLHMLQLDLTVNTATAKVSSINGKVEVPRFIAWLLKEMIDCQERGELMVFDTFAARMKELLSADDSQRGMKMTPDAVRGFVKGLNQTYLSKIFCQIVERQGFVGLTTAGN